MLITSYTLFTAKTATCRQNPPPRFPKTQHSASISIINTWLLAQAYD